MNRFTLVVALIACLSSCTLGYRHVRHGGKIVKESGELDISGSGNQLDLAVTFDFRYFRFLIPLEVGRHELKFDADDGGRDTLDLIRERRFYRLDVPVLSLYDFETHGFGGYPGLMRHRQSIDIWIGGETDFSVENEWWLDLSVAFYKYNGIGLRLFGGIGMLPVDAATPVVGTRFPRIWRGNSITYGGGVSLTVTAGEFALDGIEYLLGVDKRHRERAERQNPGR